MIEREIEREAYCPICRLWTTLVKRRWTDQGQFLADFCPCGTKLYPPPGKDPWRDLRFKEEVPV